MAKVWFVRRRGSQWVAPGGKPAFELPLADILFPLDLGTHRQLEDERPLPAPELDAEAPADLKRVMVELSASEVNGREHSGFVAGIYDSGLSPVAAAARLSAVSRSG